MDNSFDEKEYDVRPADEVKIERLVEDNRSEFQKEMDEALYLSMEEFRKEQEYFEKIEEEIKNEYLNECKKRKDIFGSFLFDLNRLLKYDEQIKEIYNIVEPIIDSYCAQYIEICQLDDATHDKIFSILSKSKVNKQAIEILKTIIIKE